MQLLKLLQRQNQLLTFLLFLFSFHCLLPLVTAQHPNSEQIIVFDEVGQMAASMAYIHVAIPLNISTYQHQVNLFDSFLQNLSTKTTSNPQAVTFTKTIRDLATFAFRRLDKLAEKLRFIDIVLPEDDLSQTPDHRQKRFLDALILPLIKPDVWARANESISGNQFDPLCRIKTRTLSTSDVQEMLNSLIGTPNEHLIQLYPIYFHSKRQIQHAILQKQILQLEPKRRQALMACHLKQQAEKQTTQIPYPDFPEFHEIFVNTSFTTTTTTTTPIPSYRVFSDHTTLPPPRLIRFKRHDTHANAADITTIPDLDYDEHNDERSGRQFLMGLGAVGGVLGTIFGLFN